MLVLLISTQDLIHELWTDAYSIFLLLSLFLLNH